MKKNMGGGNNKTENAGMKPTGEMSGVAKVANVGGGKTDHMDDAGYYSERGDSKGGQIEQSQKGLRGTTNYDSERDGR